MSLALASTPYSPRQSDEPRRSDPHSAPPALHGIASIAQSNTRCWQYLFGDRRLLSPFGDGGTVISPGIELSGINDLQRGAHFPIGAAARKLGSQGPEVDAVFLADRLGAEPVLLVMVQATEADTEDVVRRLPNPGLAGRAQMGKD